MSGTSERNCCSTVFTELVLVELALIPQVMEPSPPSVNDQVMLTAAPRNIQVPVKVTVESSQATLAWPNAMLLVLKMLVIKLLRSTAVTALLGRVTEPWPVTALSSLQRVDKLDMTWF